MTITSLNPWQVFDQLHQDNLRRYAATGQRWQPAVDISESKERYEIRLDLPGVKPEQVQVELEEGKLKISGEKKRVEAEGMAYRYKERTTGAFSRLFKLPDDADLNGIRQPRRGLRAVRDPGQVVQDRELGAGHAGGQGAFKRGSGQLVNDPDFGEQLKGERIVGHGSRWLSSG